MFVYQSLICPPLLFVYLILDFIIIVLLLNMIVLIFRSLRFTVLGDKTFHLMLKQDTLRLLNNSDYSLAGHL